MTTLSKGARWAAIWDRGMKKLINMIELIFERKKAFSCQVEKGAWSGEMNPLTVEEEPLGQWEVQLQTSTLLTFIEVKHFHNNLTFKSGRSTSKQALCSHSLR